MIGRFILMKYGTRLAASRIEFIYDFKYFLTIFIITQIIIIKRMKLNVVKITKEVDGVIRSIIID